ncbi:HU family DNA-binding protein [Acetobacter tropicalis]|uniref:HU family DNA-binding protein n=1 Tax=Acetobacter tropicalis TaxID=104102 RepID=UPI003976B5A0
MPESFVQKASHLKISELVDHIAETTDASKTDTRKVLDALVEATTAAAKKAKRSRTCPSLGPVRS